MVEDDDTVAALVEPLIEQLGYRAVRVSSAQDALDLLASGEKFDLIFSDIMMAGELNGLQLARLLRERDPDLPIVLTTGYSPAVETAAAEFPLLKKPYQPDELARVLADSLQS
jgi:CheY-like chemotaxis protein